LVLGYELKWTLDTIETGQYVFTIISPTGTHTSDGLGFGILSVFYIVASFFDIADNSLVCIDEPELSMHPQIQ
jgi:predicted ATPase